AAEGDAVGGAGVAGEGEDLAAGVRVPHLDGAVPARGRQPPAVGAERHGADVAGVAVQGEQLLAGGRAPGGDGVVVAAGGEPAALGAEGDGADLARVAAQAQRAAVARRLEVAPLPAAPPGRALVEQLLGTGRVAGRPRLLRQGDPAVV